MSLRARLLVGMAVVAVVLVRRRGRRAARHERHLVDQVDAQLASGVTHAGRLYHGGPAPAARRRSRRS